MRCYNSSPMCDFLSFFPVLVTERDSMEKSPDGSEYEDIYKHAV